MGIRLIHESLLPALEPQVVALRRRSMKYDTLAALSMAISLKRIADVVSADPNLERLHHVIESSIQSGLYRGERIR